VLEGVELLEGVAVSVGVAVGPTMVSMWVLKFVVPADTLQPKLRSRPMQICAGPVVTSTKTVD
jgi:hypothetical protein